MTIDDPIAAFSHHNQVICEVAKSHQTSLVGGEDTMPADAEHYADSVHFTDAESVSMAPQVGEALISFGEPSVLSCELAGADRASGLTTVTDLSRCGIPDSAGGWLHNYATRMVA